MTVRAKFVVLDVKHAPTQDSGPYAQVTMVPVWEGYRGGVAGDNKSWSKYTPSGEIKMSITNPSAIEAFEPGKLYDVDFTPAA